MEATLPGHTALPILKNSVEHMTQEELRAFIPRILRLESGGIPLIYSQHLKPVWWPGNLPFSSIKNLKDTCKHSSSGKFSWTQELRNIVRNCYHFYGQEHLLKGDDAAVDDDGSIKVVNNQDGSVSFITDQTVVTLENRQNTQYASCPSMEAATPGRSLSACTGLQPMPTGLFKSTNNTQNTTIAAAREKPFVEVFMCFYCEQQFHHREILKHHQKFACILRPAEPTQQSVYKTRRSTQMSARPTPRRFPQEVVKVIPRKPRKLKEDKVTFPAKGVYIESLDLLPQAKAERVRRQSLGKKIDCDVIEVEASPPPKTPTTPRTPKSLISQLSRDASPPGRTRLLSRDGSPTARVRLRLSEDQECKDGDIKEEASDDESECSKSENGEDKYRPRRVPTLLNIDLSSLLGCRVSKHISEFYDNNEHDSSDEDGDDSPINTYENFCRTPTKSNDTGRLRSRGNEFQVTFKKTKRTAPKHAHSYKFRRSELSEFCRVVETGLNRRSRALKRQTRKCKIMLSRLSKADIARWCQPFKQMHLSMEKQTEIERWMSGCGPATSSFTQFDYLRALLCQNDTRKVDYRSREHYLYKNMSQQVNSSAAGVTGSAAELTPPNTPEGPTGLDEEDIIFLDDLSPPRPPTAQICSTPPQKRPRKTPLTPRNWVDDGDTRIDDVISISSTESDSDLKVISPESLKRAANFSPVSGEVAVKQRRIEALRPSVLLFRCHLCFKEITCENGANVYIKEHFAACHNVYNIDLIEHTDASGQKVVSIVEVQMQQNLLPASSVRDAAKCAGKTFYSQSIPNKTKPAASKPAASKPAKPSLQAAKHAKQKVNQAKSAGKKVTSTKVTSTKVAKPQPKAKAQSKNVTSKVNGTKKVSSQVRHTVCTNKSNNKAASKKATTKTIKPQLKGRTLGKTQTKQQSSTKPAATRAVPKPKVSQRVLAINKGVLKVKIQGKMARK